MKIKPFLKPLSLLLVSMLFLTACAGSGAQAASTTSTGVVSTVTQADTLQASGNLGASQLSALTWGTSGVVDKVNVKVGQTVKAGEVLAMLKSDSVPAAIVTAQAELNSAKNDLQILQDSQASQAAAQQAVADAEQTVNTAQTTLDGTSYARASAALIDSLQTKIDSAKRSVKRAAATNAIAQKKKSPFNASTAALNLATAQLNLSTQIANFNWYTGKPNPIDTNILRANLAVAQASLADAQRNWKNLQHGPDPVALAAAQARVAAAQSTVNGMAIIAPFDGQVLAVQTSAGSSINKGEAAVEIVNPATLKVEVLIDETAISAVSVGDAAGVTMDMLPGITFKGKVTIVSAIGATVNGLVKYTVTVVLDPTSQPVRFGSTANVTLTTGQPQTLLAVPVSAVRSDGAGEYVLQVNADGTSQRITVTSGSTAGSLMTISTTAALKQGDQVALNP